MEEVRNLPASPAGSRSTRVALLLAPALVFVGLLAVGVLDISPPPQVGDPAPGFEAELLEGEGTLALEDLKGRPVVINFWASWCLPCKDEAPMLREAERSYGDAVTFVGVNIRDARSHAMQFARRWRLDYTLVRDEDLAIYDDYGLTGQPETFFVDEDGIILEHVPGPLSRETLFGLLDSLRARTT